MIYPNILHSTSVITGSSMIEKGAGVGEQASPDTDYCVKGDLTPFCLYSIIVMDARLS